MVNDRILTLVMYNKLHIQYPGNSNPLIFDFQVFFMTPRNNSKFKDILIDLKYILPQNRVLWIQVHKDSQSETLIPDGTKS